MNGKKSRAIRKSVENNGVDVTQVAYTNKMHDKRLYNPNGSVFMQLFTTKRIVSCGRSLYQQAKQNQKLAV